MKNTTPCTVSIWKHHLATGGRRPWSIHIKRNGKRTTYWAPTYASVWRIRKMLKEWDEHKPIHTHLHSMFTWQKG